jgi:AcrR family transcriptional regulator
MINQLNLGAMEPLGRERRVARSRARKKVRARSGGKLNLQNKKVRAIVAAARRLFMDEGIAAPSMDLIATTAGVSKATLYVYFPDREHLLVALVEHEIASCGVQLLWEPGTEVTDIGAALRGIARRLMTFFLALRSNDRPFHRLLEDLTRDRPQLGPRFFAAGPGKVRQQLVAFLTMANTQHLLAIRDVDLAAMQFTSLVHGDLRVRQMLAMPRPTKKELNAMVEGAVRVFLAAYGRMRRP